MVILSVMMSHGALPIFAVHRACVLHAQQVCLKVLVWVDTGAQVPSTEDRVVVTRVHNTVDVDLTLTEAQSVLGRERALVYVANRDAGLVPADTSSARYSSKANKFGLDNVTVVVNT